MTSNKLLIVVLGVSNSYTSMVAKFLLDNGAVGGEFCPERDEEYPRYENRYLKEYEDGMLTVGNKTKPLEDHINSLEDDVVMIKGSDIGYDLDKFSFNRRVKVVYCLRNPRNVIDANIERKNYGFTYYFDRYCNFYDMMMDQCQVYPLITERIMIDSRSLLDYCGLFGMSDFSSIGTFKKRNASYIKHRAKSFFKKRLYD